MALIALGRPLALSRPLILGASWPLGQDSRVFLGAHVNEARRLGRPIELSSGGGGGASKLRRLGAREAPAAHAKAARKGPRGLPERRRAARRRPAVRAWPAGWQTARANGTPRDRRRRRRVEEEQRQTSGGSRGRLGMKRSRRTRHHLCVSAGRHARANQTPLTRSLACSRRPEAGQISTGQCHFRA